MDFVMDMVGLLYQNIGSTFQIVEFHIETCFTLYTEFLGRMVPKWMSQSSG
jgi:hypothetical protein